MLGRLIIGIIKGLVVGGALGFGLAQLGLVAPGPVFAYAAAALAGVLVGLIAGKPIWAKDAKIEAGMKAVIGAILAAGLMFAARKWLTLGVPVSLGPLAQANESLGEVGAMGTLGGLAVTSLAMVAAVLGGFYEVDNTPEPKDGEAAAPKLPPNGNKRVAVSRQDEADDLDADVEQDKRRAKR